MMRYVFVWSIFCVAASTAFADRPVVIAHRGASGYLPEHTLAAKAMAYAQGADYLEQDVVLTRDGVPIVSHDIHLDRVTDIAERFPGRARDDFRFYAIDFTWEEVQQLRVSERGQANGKAANSHRFPRDASLFRVVSLAEELQFIQGLNHSTGKSVGVYVELKQPVFHRQEGQDLSQVVLKTLSEYGYDDADDHCFVQCFDEAEVQRLRKELHVKLPLLLLVSESKGWRDLLANPTALHERMTSISQYADGIGPNLPLLFSAGSDAQSPNITPFVAAAHQAGLKVHGWTFRTDHLACGAKDINQLHRWAQSAKLDGYFTDFPDNTVEFLRSTAP